MLALTGCGEPEAKSARAEPGILFRVQSRLGRMADENRTATELKAMASREAQDVAANPPIEGDEGPMLDVEAPRAVTGERYVAQARGGSWQIYDQVTEKYVGDVGPVVDRTDALAAAAALNDSTGGGARAADLAGAGPP